MKRYSKEKVVEALRAESERWKSRAERFDHEDGFEEWCLNREIINSSIDDKNAFDKEIDSFYDIANMYSQVAFDIEYGNILK